MDEYIIEEIYIFSVFLCAYLGYGGYEDAKGNVSGRSVAGPLLGPAGEGDGYEPATIVRLHAYS